MKTFRPTPASELPRSLYFRHVAIVAVGGLALIIAACVVAFNLTWATEMREAQQDAVAVQMAICRAGEEQVGLGKKTGELYNSQTGELSESFEKEVKALAHKSGDIHLYALNETGTEATKLTYDTDNYHVDYDASSNPAWVVSCKSLPITITY